MFTIPGSCSPSLRNVDHPRHVDHPHLVDHPHHVDHPRHVDPAHRAGVQEDHQAAAGRVSLHVRICQLCPGGSMLMMSVFKSIQSRS